MLNAMLKVPPVVPLPSERFGLPKLTTRLSCHDKLPLPADDVALPSVESHSAASVTEIVTTLVSLLAPPLPEAPAFWSLVVKVNVTLPVKFVVGAKLSVLPKLPASRLMICAIVPVSVTVPVPDPVTLTPVVPAPALSRPLETVSVVSMMALPASTSEIENALPLAVENTSVVFLAVNCGSGTAFTGASLTAVTVRLTVSVSVDNAVLPPLLAPEVLTRSWPLYPLLRSQARKVMTLLRVPLVFALGWK